MKGSAKMAGFHRLSCQVQHYAWGGYEFIPHLLGIDNPEGKPFAELWMGAHPGAPSVLKNLRPATDLQTWISENSMTALGDQVIKKYGPRLPYLFKVLDARDMLSIQVHPSKAQAEAGFAAEERAGIPRQDPKRNYKDDNHKPEIHVALSEFWMLHGFRPLEEIADALAAIPEFENLAPQWPLYLQDVGVDPDGRRALLRTLYEQIMMMPQEEVNILFDGLLARIEPLYDRGLLKKISPHYWAVKAARTFRLDNGDRDRGLFSIYLMNLLRLQPGQATFQAAGVPHAYLEGSNIELMANSDNVLRGGLTPKHVDAVELLKTLDFSSGPAAILEGVPVSGSEIKYPAPVADFALSCIRLERGGSHTQSKEHGPDCLLVLEGAVRLAGESLQRGEVLFVPAGSGYSLAADKQSVIWRATVPLD